MAEIADFIVVGGGTAGCLIASRLANTASRPSVLLLETGENNDDLSFRRTYDKFRLVFSHPELDHGYISTPQTNLDDRRVAQVRGKGLGGSSQVNFQIWSLGARDEFDQWATLVEDQGWAFDAIVQRVKKIENLHCEDIPVAYSSIVNPKKENHGYEGDVDVSIGPFFEREIDHIFDAAREHGATINTDVNSGNPLGFGLPPHTSWQGKRTSAASAFIYRQRPENLKILTASRVTRVLVNGNRAVGVEVGGNQIFTATKEIIVTAGAIDSPRLLLLSGIGPRNDLKRLGITVAKDIPGLGRSLTDHPTVFLTYHMTHGFSDRHEFDSNPNMVASASEQYTLEGDGPLNQHYSTVPTAFFKSESSYHSRQFQSLGRETKDLLQKPTVPHYEFALCGPLLPATYAIANANDGYFNFFVALQNSQSRGSVQLQSSDPDDPPLIDPNYLGNEYDVLVLIEAVRDALNYMETPTMKRYRKHAIHAPQSADDKVILKFLKDNVSGLWHPSGTMKMGSQSDRASVVGSDFKVHGYENLRVADLSVTPILPSGHPQVVAYVIGEIAAERIIQEHGL